MTATSPESKNHDPEDAAADAGLRYVTDERPGISRERKGDDWIYRKPDGSRITSQQTIDRINTIVIPPAWIDVWICTDPRGHIQATGRDDRGRKQYRYHPRWRATRDETKFDRMVEFGCARPVVGLVIPAGYSFNLDGTSIYLSMATLFIAQAYGVSLSLGQQLAVLGVLMITSKGAAGVTGSGFIVLASTLSALKVVPVEGVALVLGVDRFMSEARAITNLIGNAVATVVIAKSEGAYAPPEDG